MIHLIYERNNITYDFVSCKSKSFYKKWRAMLINDGATIIREWVS